eukprot:TRINITY_DN13552_c0_g1_i7.p1 TRINITY_DN13552_c0_g1~~TRINITY_DN13552_c0_g1_i7.p1  ORF type:complete len:517 (-),score=114.30 TRINITY_DN13552_c0_g1_i7:75-1625(-)
MPWIPPSALLSSRARDHVPGIKLAVEQLLELSTAGEAEGWRFVEEVGSVSVSKLDGTCMRGTTAVMAPPERVQMAVQDLSNLVHYSDLCSQSEAVDQLCDDYQDSILVQIGYMQLKSSSLFASDRDFVFLQCSFALEHGVKGVVRYSVTHDKKPEIPGYSRGTILVSGYVISPGQVGQSSHVLHLLSQDMGGNLFTNSAFGAQSTSEQVCALNSVRARFEGESQGELSSLTSRSKNLFSGKQDLHLSGKELDESVIQVWVADLLQAVNKSSGGWSQCSTRDGLIVESKDFGSTVLCVRTCRTISAPASQVFELVGDIARTAQYDPSFVGGRTVRSVLHKGSTTMMVNWSACSLSQIFPLFSDRDFCYLQVNQLASAGSYVVLCRSVEDDEVPRKSGFIRGTIQTSGFVIQEISGEECEVSYVCALELGGMIPKLMSDVLTKELPIKVLGVEEYFKRTLERKLETSPPNTVAGEHETTDQQPGAAPEGTWSPGPRSDGSKSPTVPSLDLSKLKKKKG